MIEALIRVVIDTNIWISALINPYGAPARMIQAIRDGRVQLILSNPLLAEVDAVLQRDRIRRRISLDAEEVEEFLRTACERAAMVSVTGELRFSRDVKDDIIVETAIVGRAQYLVSRDEDLTRDLDLVEALRGYGIDVLTVARFLEQLDAGPD